MDCEQHVSEGRQLVLAGKYTEAIERLSAHLSSCPGSAEVSGLLALAYQRAGQPREAEAAALKGLAYEPEHAGLLRRMGEISRDAGRFSRAWRFFNRAQRRMEGDGRSECLLAMSAMELQGRADTAFLDAPRGKKTVIIIAGIFPPAGGSGVWRTHKLVKYLRSYGWEPVVVTIGHRINAVTDPLYEQLPDDLEVIHIPHPPATEDMIRLSLQRLSQLTTLETYAAFKARVSAQTGTQRINTLFFPDQDIFWAHHIVDTLSQHMNLNQADLIYTTSGPYAAHLAGYFLKEKTGLPWVADFRDEWTHNPVIWPDKSLLIYRICQQLERMICEGADKVLCVAPGAIDNYVKDVGVPREKLVCITNGYDEEDFEGLSVHQCSDRFTLVHNGMLYANRTPDPVIRAVAWLADRGEISRDKFRLLLGKTGNNARWNQVITDFGLKGVAETEEMLPQRQSLERTAQADALLLMLGPTREFANTCTGKLFEYLRFRKPVICMGPKGSIAHQILEEAGAGVNVEYNDVRGIAAAILSLYRRREAGEVLTVPDADISKYDRKNTAARHAAAFDAAASAQTASPLPSDGRMLLARELIGSEPCRTAELQIRILQLHDYSSALELTDWWYHNGDMSANACMYRACALNALGRTTEALEYHRKAIQLDPLLADARFRDYPASEAYDEVISPCIGCGADDADIVYVCNQTMTSTSFGTMNPIRVWKRCRRCGLKYSAVQPTAQAIAEYCKRIAEEQRENGKAYGASEQNNAAKYRTMSSARLTNIESILGSKESLLDIGAGAGSLVAQALKEGWEAAGLECLPEACRQAQSLHGVQLIPGDLYTYSPETLYGVVTMFEVIEHLHRPKEAIQKASSLLKPGGVLVLSTPISDSRYCKSIRLITDFWWNEPGHLCYFDDATMRRYIEEAGLCIVRAADSQQGFGRMEYYAVRI